ncbi:hypothetical protein D1872_336320 [compost metagenome]
MNDLQAMDRAKLAHDLTGREACDTPQLAIIIIDNAASENLALRSNDLHDIARMEATVYPDNTDW